MRGIPLLYALLPAIVAPCALASAQAVDPPRVVMLGAGTPNPDPTGPVPRSAGWDRSCCTSQLHWGATDDDLLREIRAAGYTGRDVPARDLETYP